MLFAWILSAMAVIVLLRRANYKQNNKLFWIAFSLNFLFFIIPIAFMLLLLIAGIQV
jgi:Na+/melibiose symporter-like transporter